MTDMKKVLMTSCVKPSKEGGVANVEYYTIKGLREAGYQVDEFFPYAGSNAITDFKTGLKELKSDGIVHAHTNISWNTKNAIRTYHGCTALGQKVASIEKEHLLKSGIKGEVYLQINKIMEKRCSKVNNCLTVSQYVADALEKYYKTPAEKIRVVHNGVDNKRFYPDSKAGNIFRKKLSIKENDFVVTWTGHFEFNKGIYYLCKIIEALEQQKDIKFIVRASVKKSNLPIEYAKTLQSKNVIYLEHGLDMNEFYNAGDCHLLTSTYEPFCLTILEAMCAGKPVIATKSGGHEEVISDGKNSYLFDYTDVKGMAEQIKLLAKNETERRKVGKAAEKTILNNFTYKHMVQKTIKAYNYFYK